MKNSFLPVSQEDLLARGISEVDFVFVSGDAYVDHASFASALLGRLLEANGYTVAILPQPDWKNVEEFRKFGRPRLGFLVSAGAMDSMVSNYTANNKPRSEDVYAHGGVAGHRPDRALITYIAKIREAYKGVNILIGGIEASLRRTSHYDYWSNTVRRSILLDSKADLLMYGMGEHSILEIAEKLREGIPAKAIRGVRGTVWYTSKQDELPNYRRWDEKIVGSSPTMTDGQTRSVTDGQKMSFPCSTRESVAIMLPSYAEISKNTPESKRLFAESYLVQEQNTDAINGHILIEPVDARFIVQEVAALPLTTEEFDAIYELPFTRRWHPMYDAPAENGKTGIPALSEVQFSLVSSRGCFGACSFCAITFHQGRRIQARSHESLIKEAKVITENPDFKGYIHDVGGPTANFRHDACKFQKERGACPNKDCMGTNPCKNVNVDHTEYVELLRKLRALPKVKKVFIRSGIRFDYLMMDEDKSFFKELVEHHISGQLKVAPEHVSDKVLRLMRKSNHELYEKFAAEYTDWNKKMGKKQYLVPYYICSHPGAGLAEAIEVALYLKKTGFVPDQVQDFYPTPGSLSTCMYWTGLNPRNRLENGEFEEVYVARGAHERRLQRALLQFNRRENWPLVKEALEKASRRDLIKVLLK
ncbi:MAG: YgiQ family radical SAM protein [Treponema sp.]|uniref:YgiQ family radical SAM protein n=1 Tax=Treponema sp. TaxID=166 RepID=UPI0025F1E15D|nr:YgiQ family radical SAM protein [Treponema sp.]MBQ9282829.1 YgiQ family radical SAM protein [Treponema sp.]